MKLNYLVEIFNNQKLALNTNFNGDVLPFLEQGSI